MDKLKIKHKGGNNMNREQAKKLLPIIQAFAEGKTVQYKIEKEWIQTNVPTFNPYLWEYRIKPEHKYRPFKDAEECWQEMQKHQPFGWVKDMENGHKVAITRVNDDENTGLIAINGKSEWPLERLIECYTFADGTPFGIKEE
uniref:hypothetical protein n=1 Tax=Prevotella sp. TaxID=59823 RepID=UPI0040251419